MREKAGLSQAELAEQIGTKQGAIARLESTTYGKFSMSTLHKIAEFFDVAAWVEFVPFSTLLRRTSDLSAKALTPAAYAEEFDAAGEPHIGLPLAFDGGTICLSHYNGTARLPSWGITIGSTSSPIAYISPEHS